LIYPGQNQAIAPGGRRGIASLIEDRYGPADLAAIRVFENEGGHVVDIDQRADSSREGASVEAGRGSRGSAARALTAPFRKSGTPG
jgi:hypothetical protein